MLNKTAQAWLQARGITPRLALGHGLESVARGTGEWIAIPYLRNGKRLNAKYRRIDQKAHQQDKGAEKLVWNEDALREPEFTGPVIITEGEFDALAAIEAGYDRVVSVPDGAPSEVVGKGSTRKYSYLPSLLDLIRDAEEVILAVDGDQAGANLRVDLETRLGRARCKYLTYPEGCKDLNDVLRQSGVPGVQSVIDGAKYVAVDGLVRLRELPPPREEHVYRVNLSENFKSHIGICRGHFSVWTGIPNHGKSALLKAVACELARQEDFMIAVACFEDDPQLDFRRDVAKYLAQKAHFDLEPSDWAHADAFIDNHFRFISPNYTDDVSLDWMLERMETAVRREGSDLIIIDPWTELDHEFDGLSETQYTAICIKQMKRFARRFDVHVAMVAHPAKIAPNGDGSFRVPTGYDISGSAHWSNKPELGITVHRDVDAGTSVTLVRVWKSKRHDVMGKTGDVRLTFDPATGRYSDYYVDGGRPQLHRIQS